MLKSGTPRVAFRKSNKYIIAEYIKSFEAQDSIVFGVTSHLLMKHGWPEDMKGSLKSLPAAYLIGFHLGKKILEKKLAAPIVDLGMARIVRKNGAFAFIKGLVDSGIKMKHDATAFPDEERVKGKNLKRDFTVSFAKVKKNLESIK